MDTGRGVLNTGVYWGEKGSWGRNSRGWRDWGGVALGEIPNIDYRVMDVANHHHGTDIAL